MLAKEFLSICFVSQEYPEETGWGGIGTYTYEMAHSLARLGHRVVVLARAVDCPSHVVEDDGVEVYRILARFSLNQLPAVWRLNRFWEGYNLAVALKLREIVKTRDIDLIESPELNSETAIFRFVNKRVPIVVRLHGGANLVTNFERHTHPKFKIARRQERKLVSNANLVTAPSKSVLAVSREWLRTENATVIPNPVNVQMFSPNGGKPANAPPQLVCVGTPRPVKGFKVLAQAMPLVWQLIPDVRLVFVTPTKPCRENDPFREILGEFYEHPLIQVRSAIPHAEMPDVYRQATVCVVPSLWPEPFGYACAEPMACGVPVVASRAGALAEIIEDGESGLLVEPNNSGELAQAILRLMSDGDLAGRIGAAARFRIVQQFASTSVAERMASAYRAAIS